MSKEEAILECRTAITNALTVPEFRAKRVKTFLSDPDNLKHREIYVNGEALRVLLAAVEETL